jgi:hypothetical protein
VARLYALLFQGVSLQPIAGFTGLLRACRYETIGT